MASRSLKLSRARTQNRWDTFLTKHTADEQINGKTLISSVLHSPENVAEAPRSLREKLDSMGSDAIVIPPIKGASDLMPGNSSVMDKLVVKSEHNSAWKFPSTATLKEHVSQRQFTGEVAASMDIMVHTIFEDSTDTLIEVLEKVDGLMEKEEELWPCSAVCMAVTNVYLKSRDFDEVLAPSSRGKEAKFISFKKEAANIRPFATKIIFSGFNWAFILQFPINDDGKVYSLVNAAIPERLVDWLNDLPAVTVSDLSDAFIVEQMIQTNNESNFSFNAVVELEALAVLAGFKSSVRDMSVLSYVTTGTLCHLFTRIDHPYYILPWNEIPGEVRWSLLGVIRATFLSHRCLKLSLIHDIFPDPDVATQLTRTTTLEFMVWFSSWINLVLNHSTPDNDVNVSAVESRGELAETLIRVQRNGYSEGLCPSTVTHFASLYQDWPSVSFGGARFLLQVREAFLTQYTNLSAVTNLKGFEDMFDKDLSPFQKSHARYGYVHETAEDLNYRVPAAGDQLNLVVYPELKKKAMILDPRRKIFPADISSEGQYTNRQARSLVEEWSRLNVELIPVLFDKMRNERAILNKFAPYYEKMRVTYMNLGKKNPVDIPECESRVSRSMTVDFSESESKLTALNAHIDQLMSFKDELQAAMNMIRENEGSKHQSR